MRRMVEHDRARGRAAEHDQAVRVILFQQVGDAQEERERPQEHGKPDDIGIEGGDLIGDGFGIRSGRLQVPHADFQTGGPGGAQTGLDHAQAKVGDALRHRRVVVRIARQQSDAAAGPGPDHAGMAWTLPWRSRTAGGGGTTCP